MKCDRILYLFPAVIGAALLLSCVDELPEDGGGLSPVPEGKVRLELFTNADDFQVPVTRMGNANEGAVGSTPWVLVFRGTDENAVFYEAVQALVMGSKSYVTLTQTNQPSVLLLIANAPASFFDGTSDMAFDAANLHTYLQRHPRLADAADSLLTTRLAVPNQPTVPYASTSAPYPTIPMTGRYDAPSITPLTTIGTSASKVMLTRVVAKLTVESAAITGFLPISATVVNAPRNGRLYQWGSGLKNNAGNVTDYLTSTTGDGVSGIALASGLTTNANPIYLYESRKEEITSIIVKGSYFGQLLFYRLAFRDDNGGLIDIRRNKQYKVIISSVGSGEGYATVGEAKANPVSNIRYRIVVTDQVSADIVDNGQYYLGVSNSEFYMYESAAVSGSVVALTVTTDATTGMDIGANSITASTTVGTAFSISPSTITLASSPGTAATTEVRVTIPAYSTSTSGTITVRLGNLTKSVRFVRSPSMTPLAYPGSFSLSSVSGEVSSQGTGGDSWLTFSADGVTPGAEKVYLSSPGILYLMAKDNLVESGGSVRTGGEVYIARTGVQGRIKVNVSQSYAVIGQNNSLSLQYVGTFHRWNQTGERLIRIPGAGGSDGAWTAKVIKGSDFIVLDTISSQDPGVTYNVSTESPADMGDPANDGTYSVNSSQRLIRGVLPIGSNTFIRFRVGLVSTLPGGASGSPRYGLIALGYNGNAKYMYIYVRQGEGPDYVMRPEDAVNSGGMVSSTRPLARKFSPYSLTDPQRGTGNVDRGTRGYSFADYPSQAGYYFQWGRTMAWYPAGAASNWSTVAISGYWADNGGWETCPPGYHRPNDGSTGSASNPAGTTADVSELRQSLWVNPSAVSSQEVTNSVYGYYADGYFDRRAIVLSSSGISSSTVGSNDGIAYIGRLFFNPATRASLFFPSAGLRSNPSGALGATGATGYFWTSSANGANGSYLSFSTIASSITSATLLGGEPLRCVADP